MTSVAMAAKVEATFFVLWPMPGQSSKIIGWVWASRCTKLWQHDEGQVGGVGCPKRRYAYLTSSGPVMNSVFAVC
jgi:hypothetical protein